jgi:hypothetical protein
MRRKFQNRINCESNIASRRLCGWFPAPLSFPRPFLRMSFYVISMYIGLSGGAQTSRALREWRRILIIPHGNCDVRLYESLVNKSARSHISPMRPPGREKQVFRATSLAHAVCFWGQTGGKSANPLPLICDKDPC